MRHTFWSCLIRCANMKWIQWVLLKIQSRHDSVHRRTDRKGETSIPPFQLRWSGGYNKQSFSDTYLVWPTNDNTSMLSKSSVSIPTFRGHIPAMKKHTPINHSSTLHIDGLVQKRRNSSALAMELRLFCTNPSIFFCLLTHWGLVSNYDSWTIKDWLFLWCCIHSHPWFPASQWWHVHGSQCRYGWYEECLLCMRQNMSPTEMAIKYILNIITALICKDFL